MRIVLLKPGDEELLQQAERAFNAPPSPSRCAMLLSDPTFIMVVALTDDGEVMGRIYGHALNRYDATDLLLYEVDVDEAHQRRGAARAMLAHLHDICSRRGYGEMWVLTDPDNEEGNGLYRSAGGHLENSPTNMYVFPIAKR